MSHKPTRQEMVNALTAYELKFLIDNPECLPDVAEFFANGGFDNVTEADLQEVYQMKIVEG